METDGNLYLLWQALLHLTLTLRVWLARQQIPQSVSHDCISIAQTSPRIPSHSCCEHRLQSKMLCCLATGIPLTNLFVDH